MTRLHSVTYGPSEGIPLVFVGSLGSSVKMWLHQLDHFAATRPVIAIDLPGHGHSDVIAGSPSMADFAEAVLKAAPQGQFDLVGLSLGGAIAQHIALHYPDRVHRLALVSTAAVFGEPEAWVHKAADVRAGKLDQFSHGTLERWFSPGWRESHPASLEYWRSMVARTDAEGYASACMALSTFNSRAELPGLSVPTLVVAGIQDTSTPPEVVRELAELIPGAHYVELDPAAHLLNVERAEDFNSLLADFLDQKS
ncbi:alpha/beta fold hydrolase [Corynebacterium epidermidicanis]|uniref:Putative hydrolase or acyltransferase of alpha/beta superfamily n=1 Tax=Corynebacterium epidermidicanis TaxID=1050174 RepID=A0A0G3GRP5_9CORY|nr:alpha/beta fold hydrolase [Corynebacterium epidermidicanis]AKK03794.1 putative hydrolase or acyltransferase of alpha/beta superfamily [Corynebacterium epidermidicanis]